MGRKSNATSGMDVAEKQATPLARRLNGLIADGNALKDYLGVSAQAINQYRLGMARPSLENLCKIAKFYGVSTDYLLGLTDTPSTKEDIQAACKTTGLSTSVIEWLKTITGDPAKIDALNSILDSKTFQAILPYIDELKGVQIAAEMNRLGPVNEQVKSMQVKEISGGQYLVGGYEYLSVLEYRIAELLKIVIDEVTRPCLEELGGE